MLEEHDITSLPSHELFERGVLRTFQLAHEFSNMTVLENLMVVPGMQTGEKILNTWFQRKKIEKGNINNVAAIVTPVASEIKFIFGTSLDITAFKA